MRARLSEGRPASEKTIVGLMIGLVLGCLLMAMTGSLFRLGSRNLVAMGNYPGLDTQSRNAFDSRSLKLRSATQVIGFQNGGSSKSPGMTEAGVGATLPHTGKATP